MLSYKNFMNIVFLSKSTNKRKMLIYRFFFAVDFHMAKMTVSNVKMANGN